MIEGTPETKQALLIGLYPGKAISDSPHFYIQDGDSALACPGDL